MRRRLPALLLTGALWVGALATLLPLLWMLSGSLMETGESSSLPLHFLPRAPTLAQYRTLFLRLDLGVCFLNSTLLAAAVTAASLWLSSMAGYAFAKLRFRGRGPLFNGLLAAMVIPAQVAMLPLFLLLRALHLVDSYWGVILPAMASLFGIFLVRQYALSIPDELLDAARIDGAGEIQIYRSIMLPLCRPILVTLALFTFLGSWNDFFWPLVVLTDKSHWTLPVALANVLGEHAGDTELMMAGAVLTVVPVLLLFLALQRHYIEGITLGGVKE
jgi:multiple sugar transport system permease protein